MSLRANELVKVALEEGGKSWESYCESNEECGYVQVGDYYLRIHRPLGEVHIAYKPSFDRWANSRDFWAFYPKTYDAMRRLCRGIKEVLDPDGIDQVTFRAVDVSEYLTKRYWRKK